MKLRIVLMVVMVGAALTMARTAAAQDLAAKGAELYTAQKCNVCHAVAGKGPGKNVLDGVGSKLSADDIRNWIVNPAEMTKKMKSTAKPPMKSYASLAKADVDALVAYLQTLKKK